MENATRRSFLGLLAGAGVVVPRRRRSRVSHQVSPCRQLKGCGRRSAGATATVSTAPACGPESPCSLRDAGRQQPQHPAVAVPYFRPRDPRAARSDATPSSVDPDNHHLFASLGCATENLVQAAAAFGLARTRLRRGRRRHKVDLEKAPPARSPLFEAIPLRQSTRSVFDGRAVPAEHLQLLEAAGFDDRVELLLFTDRKQIEDILSYLIAGNSAQMDDAAFIAELKSWLRFNYAEALATGDGLFSKCPAIRPCRAGSDGRCSVSSSPRTARTRSYAAQLRSSSGVAVFISDKNEPASWSAAGRCCQRFALQATASAFAIASSTSLSKFRRPGPIRQFPWRWRSAPRSRDEIWIRTGIAKVIAPSGRRSAASGVKSYFARRERLHLKERAVSL